MSVHCTACIRARKRRGWTDGWIHSYTAQLLCVCIKLTLGLSRYYNNSKGSLTLVLYSVFAVILASASTRCLQFAPAFYLRNRTPLAAVSFFLVVVLSRACKLTSLGTIKPERELQLRRFKQPAAASVSRQPMMIYPRFFFLFIRSS